ncbi:uncharacterized protein P174DRAFT_177379 [Aspergillus novofumigatus IBT 16806]|uniref:Uncharacterized protein n=1 Tax=Aspergillus novofumigatus (strain IBT 16806) TaxID=1392255 RepID=A0A2I1C9E8_ASPN1|nr:uncharacterized protein P174DRAFT_177379 [Aspergillus novofumigatus IBT 16806]PKX94267.1 hypothetical protein P174DRAFT_177379 [Aspergillus novofumigatus IBT 16806]
MSCPSSHCPPASCNMKGQQPLAASEMKLPEGEPTMEEHNLPDMRIFIEETLNRQGLRNAPPGSNQQKAQDKIIEKLLENVKGSYSRLKFGLDDVIRLLSTRTAILELDQMLDQSISSHEAAIKNLQQSLTANQIKE